jgi:hypothetical protein
MSPGQLLLAAFLTACLIAPALSQTAVPQTPPAKSGAGPAAAPRPVAVTSGSGRTEFVGSRSSFKALRGR